MKILELHLRNIASIEKADIDFENDPGLIDPDTGSAAQKFLIYGDTGTGKSVLLDGIAMALYGKTPRIIGIENKLKNSFTDAYGNEMSVTSLEQYTRLGISANDDCYSEVVFVGNDGKTYRAKMQLGLTKSRGVLRSKKRWFLKEDEKDWIEGTQCGKVIEAAVGLSFEQFNRMAMLAQGQFSNFLCGGREERASILERLTNTSVFTSYGKAIRTIFDRRKEAAEVAKKAIQTAESYILSNEETQFLEKQMNDEGERGRKAAEERKELNNKINLITKINDNIARKDEAEKRLAQLHDEAQSDTYAARVNLCRDWDATDNERRCMAELAAKRAALEAAQTRDEALRNRYGELAADTARRQQDYAAESARIEQELAWLAERKERDTLYAEAKAVLSQMEQFARNSNAVAALQKEKAAAESRVETLARELDAAETEMAGATSAANDAQKVIDSLLATINELNPHQTDIDARNLATLRTAYEKLHSDRSEWIERQQERAKQSTQLQLLSEELAAKRTLWQTLTEQSAKAQAAYEKALRRLTAIDASLDDKLDELRKMIVAEQTDICPLCGQKIADTILTKEQFAELVTPYEEERRKTKAEAEQAQKQLKEAAKAVSTAEGSIRTLKEMLTKMDATIAEGQKDLVARMAKAGIDPNGDIDAEIAQKLEQIALDENALLSKREQLARHQKEMDSLLKAKKPLDERLNIATAQQTLAKSKAHQNKEKINDLSAKISTAQAVLADDRDKLETTLALWFPRWQEDLKGTAAQLQTEAAEYLARKKDCSNAVSAQQRRHEQMETIAATKERISALHPDWEAAEDSGTPIDEPLRHWSDLWAQCSTVSSTIADCRQAMTLCSEVLAAWEKRSGKDRSHLATLEQHKDDIAKARKYLSEFDSEVKIWQKVLGDAGNGVAEARRTLGLADGEPVPDKGELDRRYLEAENSEREANRLFAEAHTKLETNKKQLAKLAEAKAVYDQAIKQYEHWRLLDKRFGDNRFRNLVQTHILTPLLNNANIYLSRISDRYTLTCSAENEQLSILVLDRYNRNEVRSAAVLSGGEKFMISLALSLALSSLNRPDMNVNILFIDEGFGTLDQECLNSVMTTLGRLGEISGQSNRRVGIISHREELLGCIPNKIKLKKIGEGRSKVEIVYEP